MGVRPDVRLRPGDASTFIAERAEKPGKPIPHPPAEVLGYSLDEMRDVAAYWIA